MASSSASQYFEIPKFFLFSEKGIFSGSKSDRDFNYKVIPVCPKEGDKCLKANIWSGQNCLEQTENVTTKEFPFSEEGHAEMLKWLESEYLSRPEVSTVVEQQQEFVRRITAEYVSLEDFLERNNK